VSFTTISPASPQLYGTAVTFTATATGGGTGAVYNYRFTLDGGTPTAWSTTNTFVMPSTTVAATHTVKVDATTEAVPATVQATTTTSYVINPAPYALTITPSVASPHSPPVTFTAAASGGSGGETFVYRFYTFDGTTWVQQTPWPDSTNPTWTLPVGFPAGTYTVIAQVRTGPTASPTAEIGMTYVVQ
jgi:hypothetical protein